jgi:hypothetical protein
MREYQQQLRERFLAAPVMAAPAPWLGLTTPYNCIPVGGLLGVGFAADPADATDLLMVVSHDGRGLFDPATGAKIARDRDPDPDLCVPTGPDLSCPGIGSLADTRVGIAGLFGGGLHTATDDGWTVDVVAPDWPNERVILSLNGDIYRGTVGTHWWHVFNSDYSELRAAGFSASGRTMVVATSSDIMLWHRS